MDQTPIAVITTVVVMFSAIAMNTIAIMVVLVVPVWMFVGSS